jgi:dienelactone hydrolase
MSVSSDHGLELHRSISLQGRRSLVCNDKKVFPHPPNFSTPTFLIIHKALGIEMADNLHPCCDPAAPSPIWKGTSSGTIITIDGIETYIARPKYSKESGASGSSREDRRRVILHLTEGHSIYFINAQLFADSFASQLGCDVIMPDQFRGEERVPVGQLPHFPDGKPDIPRLEAKEEGDAAEGAGFDQPPYHRGHPLSMEDLDTWKQKFEPPVTDPILAKILKYIHQVYGEEVKIGGVGYCFGGRYVMRLMGSGVIDVGVVNHPSLFTLGEVERIGNGKRLAIYAAETDDILPAEKRRATEDVLTKGGATWMSAVFSGTEHGFSVRGDLNIKEVRLAKEQAFRGAIEWFRDWL